jgi:hypothetical protein
VKLELHEKRVEIELAWTAGQKAGCPVCGQACTLYDLAPERTWRHLVWCNSLSFTMADLF